MDIKYSAITVEPKSDHDKASITIEDDVVCISGWHFDMKGRPGDYRKYADEIIVAVIDWLARRAYKEVKNKALLPAEAECATPNQPQLEFEAERMACLAINFAAQKA